MAHILMIMNGKGIGGAELQFVELANQLARANQVTMVCLHGRGAVDEGRLAEGIALEVYPYSSGRSAAPMVARAIRNCRRHPADAIVTTAFIGNLVGFMAGLGKGRRLVSLQTVSERKRFKRVERMILRHFDTLVAGCQDISQFLTAEGQAPNRIKIVNNWVDFSTRQTTETSDETRARFGLNQGHRVIGCIGRMHHQKGQEFLIRAFKDISREHPDARLVLVGDGPIMAQMKAEAAGHPNILFTGTITGHDYNNLLAAFDIYAQPSRYEGLPRTLLDAMYLGLPIVATAVNGNLDALRDGENGLLVPAEDSAALAHGLSRLLADPDLGRRLARSAADDARNEYSMHTQTRRIELLIAGQQAAFGPAPRE